MPERRKVTRSASSTSALVTPRFAAPISWARTACWSRSAAAIAIAISFLVFFEILPSSQICCSNFITSSNISGSLVVSSLKNFGTLPIFFSRSLRLFFVAAAFEGADAFLVTGAFFVTVFAIFCSLHKLHGFPAADQFSAAGFFHDHNISADLALEDLPFLRYINHWELFSISLIFLELNAG